MTEPRGDAIMADVLKMIETLQQESKFGPALFYLPDSAIVRMGGNPGDYPMLEGYPGVRVVEMK